MTNPETAISNELVVGMAPGRSVRIYAYATTSSPGFDPDSMTGSDHLVWDDYARGWRLWFSDGEGDVDTHLLGGLRDHPEEVVDSARDYINRVIADQKARLDRLRRAARRQGVGIFRSRARNPRAATYGLWHVMQNGVVIAGGQPNSHSMTTNEVEDFLRELS